MMFFLLSSQRPIKTSNVLNMSSLLNPSNLQFLNLQILETHISLVALPQQHQFSLYVFLTIFSSLCLSCNFPNLSNHLSSSQGSSNQSYSSNPFNLYNPFWVHRAHQTRLTPQITKISKLTKPPKSLGSMLYLVKIAVNTQLNNFSLAKRTSSKA